MTLSRALSKLASLLNSSGQLPASALQSEAQPYGFKNRLINGSMVFDQRNNGNAINPSNGTYAMDRWKCYQSTTGKYTIQQSSVAPPGFTKSALVTSSAATTLAATDYNLLEQIIEVGNFADMQWGTANASPATMSFWVRCSTAGTFGGSLRTVDSTYNYIFSYTINAANTWEFKTITVPGAPAGNWGTVPTDGAIQVCWGLGVGSTYSAAAGSWSATGNLFSATGATNFLATNGATWYITGVQFEKGSTATSFDYRPYGAELVLCQRYYEKSYDLWTVPGATSSFNGSMGFLSRQVRPQTFFAVSKRSNPAMTAYAPNTGESGKTYKGGSAVAVAFAEAGSSGFTLQGFADSADTDCRCHWTANSEL